MVVDLNALVLGLAFGLVLATAIVLLLVHATVNTPQMEDLPGISTWKPISRYESQRTYLHASGHHPDVIDW
jgi:hypothetical protein